MIAAPADRSRSAAAIGVALGAAVVFAIAAHVDAAGAWRMFLANLLFWSGVAGGGAAFAALLELTGAEWTGAIRRIAETSARFLAAAVPLMLLLIAGTAVLFDAAGRRASSWIAVRDALAVGALYACSVASVGGRWRRSPAAVVLLLVFAAVMSLLAIDLVMRFDPQWTSTLFPGYFAVTNVYAGISAVAVAAALAPSRRDAPALDEKRARSMGALLLGFSFLWIYLFWSQYLVIWYGNLPDEFAFLVARTRDGWRIVSAAVLACCFAVPSLLLLARRTSRMVVAASCFSLAGIWLERLLLVFPSHPWRGIDAIAAVALAAGFGAAFVLSGAVAWRSSAPVEAG